MKTNQNDTNRSEVPENLIPAYEAAGQAILANFHAPDDKHSTWWINLPEISSAVIAAVATLIEADFMDINAVRKQIAAEIRAVAADPTRPRPLRADAETRTDYADDFEWAALIAEGSL